VLDLVDLDLEWAYLNPMQEGPGPQTCHRRDEARDLADVG